MALTGEGGLLTGLVRKPADLELTEQLRHPRERHRSTGQLAQRSYPKHVKADIEGSICASRVIGTDRSIRRRSRRTRGLMWV